MISHHDRGTSIHCFRCGYRGWEPHGPRSISEILASRAGEDYLSEQSGVIPDRATRSNEWPKEAILWVLKGNLSPEIACEEYGFKYDPVTRRMLIPLLGGQQAFVSRAIFGQKPKYLISGHGDRYMIASGHQGYMVVVEDILSAIAVNRAGWPAMAILGTSISPWQAQALAVDHLIAWFDDDVAGHAAWLKLRRRMSLWPTHLYRVISQHEPKHIPRAFIREKLMLPMLASTENNDV